ncbi:MAG TPA: polyprenyl diphosphate synthase [Candidatus Paceibacterota bacterium]|nr:polyprenyl diphosphate synthase [Candidatus Pacearchaeota archaeon]HRZ51228.1 polyprenyl diphosphate synthase [Candidatus Paceibacterota bacterium]HSA36950.1 polyprenyl diphosphate synthase [Candidatus Paceibacterota bacterium]
MPNNTDQLPRHLGIIIDGNRRWAKASGKPTLEGHKKGFDSVKTIIEASRKRGIKTLTFFCFSTENWKRSEEEVGYLMNLLETALIDCLKKFGDEDVRIKVIGQIKRLPDSIQKEIAKVEKATENNKSMLVNLAISYGGRTEIVEAIKSIIKSGVNPDEITEETVKEHLWTSDVDLIIRTGGEQRLSGFLLWHAAYSEFLFIKKYWPEFTEADLDAALADYAARSRRFGK